MCVRECVCVCVFECVCECVCVCVCECVTEGKRLQYKSERKMKAALVQMKDHEASDVFDTSGQREAEN